jgi:hypothetical protein
MATYILQNITSKETPIYITEDNMDVNGWLLYGECHTIIPHKIQVAVGPNDLLL